MKTKDLFISEVNRLWNTLKERDDTIFENVSIGIDPEKKFDELRENNNGFYMVLIHENSVYEKKKLIGAYFWENIVGDLYEHTISIMKQAGLLEEALGSFEKNYKIENTARLILENGVFSRFSPNKKKELVETVVEVCFYPVTNYENNISLLNDGTLEEAWVKPTINWFGDRIRDIARLTHNAFLGILFLLVTPATALIGQPAARAGDAIMGTRTGMDPTLRKMYSMFDALSPVNLLFKFLNTDLYDIANYLKKVNNLEDEYLQDVLKEMKADPAKTIDKCWNKNKFQLSGIDPEQATMYDKLRHFISGKGLANFLRDPKYNNEAQIAMVLQKDAADPKYQKMFYDFRVCVYEKVFEIILGYAKAIYSMDDASYEIIKAANEAHKNKNFKAFFDLRPKQANEEAMFKIMRALVAIDSTANTLEKRRGELVADKYIDKFVDFLRQNIKQVYQELNDMANQRKYNEDRYKVENPSDEEKAEAIKKERFNAKKSIFEDI